jgi:hypothetical protein
MLDSKLADKIPDTFSVKFNATSPSNGRCRVESSRSSIGAKFER